MDYTGKGLLSGLGGVVGANASQKDILNALHRQGTNEKKPMSETQHVMKELEASLLGLEDTIIELEGRLVPILQDIPAIGQNIPLPERQISSPLGIAILDSMIRVKEIERAARELLDRLAV